jgi:integrase
MKKSCEAGYVFANSETGRPLVCIKRAFEKALENAGIEGFRFHDLRHTAATRMGEAGIGPFTIDAILSHKSIAMTASYTHATQQAKLRAVAVLEYEQQRGWRTNLRLYLNVADERAIEADSS